MQNRFTMFRRGTMFYCEDRTTGQQKSLLTKDETEASKIVQAKNDAVNQPLMNLVMAKTYLIYEANRYSVFVTFENHQ